MFGLGQRDLPVCSSQDHRTSKGEGGGLEQDIEPHAGIESRILTVLKAIAFRVDGQTRIERREQPITIVGLGRREARRADLFDMAPLFMHIENYLVLSLRASVFIFAVP